MRPALACCLAALLAVCVQLAQVQSKMQAAEGRAASLLELKFQTELDSSTVIKRPEQQQVFKCQVRLAPAQGGAANLPPRARFKSTSKLLEGPPGAGWTQDDNLATIGAGQQLNVTRLSIEWLKDDRLLALADEPSEQVAVVNVSLQARGEGANNKQQQPAGAKTRRARLEIKNTLNGGQLKLTSRLRIARARPTDAGHYKCLARATLVQRQPTTSASLVQVDQALESNSTALVVAPADSEAVGVGGSNLVGARENGARKKWAPTSGGGGAEAPTARQAKESLHSTGLEEMKHGDIQAPTNQLDGLADTSLAGGAGNAWNLFEDDEDLFRAEPAERAGELINGQQQQPPPPSAGLANEENNDNTKNQEQMIEFSDNGEPLAGGPELRPHKQPDAYLDWVLQQQQQQSQQSQQSQPPLQEEAAPGRFMSAGFESGAPARGAHELGGAAASDEPLGRRRDQHRAQPARQQAHNQVTSFLRAPPAELAAGALGKSKLAKLVHRIAPELSCYTGVGEHYHGHIAAALDQRPCLNWLHVRLALAGQRAAGANRSASGEPGALGALATTAAYATRLDNHSACRNPNADARGPWCFVAHSEQLDGLIINQQAMAAAAASRDATAAAPPLRLTTHKQRAVWLGAHGQLFVVRPCALASCSEYLWLYVVAPPLGLLVLLTCLASVAIRAIRKSHYNAIFSAAYQRHSNASNASKLAADGASARSPAPLVGRLLARRLGRALGARAKRRNCFLGAGAVGGGNKSSSATSGKKANYLDDDIFEIVDDIDWSDGQTATSSAPLSMASPKSAESFRLNAATFGHSPTRRHHPNHHPGKATLSHSKSVNPVFCQQAAAAATSGELSAPPQPPPRLAGNAVAASTMSKSKSQAGPMFATLRCHVRNNQQQASKRLNEAANNRCQQQQTKLGADGQRAEGGNWLGATSSITSNLSSLQADDSASEQAVAVKTGHLISCSPSSSSSTASSAGNGAFAGCNNAPESAGGGELILARDLPQLNPASVTVAHETQPIYEGKFSQVQWAYLKQRDSDAAQATGRIGAQVAVCGLKQQAGLAEGAFRADCLRLRNLNHLNVLKLIGYVQYSAAGAAQQASCALVYDMAHLMDLSDWLKEQSKESVTIGRGDGPTGELSLRQNLACLAKQIALAVDYLHDKQIIYKDLACRNCFLDVTRMLVKLATFNIEPELDTSSSGAGSEYDVPQQQQQQQQQQPRVARKCADAKIGATTASASSDPATTTTANTTLSTTNDDINKRLSLKSMVRPKYLLDYYVIDSRPSECQMLPLSWIPLESILFNKFNRQTDIWSFGCLLYELFSLGEVAYFGYSSKQVIDSVRSNLMPPQPMLCPNGIYKLMCKCLSDIPTLRPNIKHVYEQLNLYSGQCSSFLNHHLCMI